ncbi:hypothetical protein C8R43DRAFT_945535 [Mycena crocata]|nr:hypothetical protein C8R43DRAFT_945535 [Mycena crocata]
MFLSSTFTSAVLNVLQRHCASSSGRRLALLRPERLRRQVWPHAALQQWSLPAQNELNRLPRDASRPVRARRRSNCAPQEATSQTPPEPSATVPPGPVPKFVPEFEHIAFLSSMLIPPRPGQATVCGTCCGWAAPLQNGNVNPVNCTSPMPNAWPSSGDGCMFAWPPVCSSLTGPAFWGPYSPNGDTSPRITDPSRQKLENQAVQSLLP